jgi:hypothetical protein
MVYHAGMRVCILLSCLLAASCDQPADDEDRIVYMNLAQQAEWGKTPLEAYLDPKDRELASKPYSGGALPCEDKSTDQCFKMTEPQRWVGLWRSAFEGSNFCAAPAATCTDAVTDENVWLDWRSAPEPDGALYQVEFIGRRTKYGGEYGHLGMSQHEIIVDRMLSMKMIEPGERPMTKAEQKALEAECRKAKQCLTLDELNEMHVRH